jgi:hypothetical protein
VSQILPFEEVAGSRRRPTALPSWLISLLLHTGLLCALGTVSWTASNRMPQEPPVSVGIMLKKDSPSGAVFESQGATFASFEAVPAPTKDFLPKAEPDAISNALPKLPAVELPLIGMSGSSGIPNAGELLAPVDSSNAVPAAMVNTQFFGAQVWGNKFVYVIDRSGSMSQRDRIGAAKRELVASLGKLPPDTQFQVIFYNLEPYALLQPSAVKLHYATDSNRALVARELESLAPIGGTMHLLALKMALAMQPDVVFFLTDADDLRAHDVQEATTLNQGRTKIHTIEFGIGADEQRENQLRELAKQNGGSYRYIDAAKLMR